MDNIIISFCIATFERYKILKELILEILSVDSQELEIVVCDDCSKDDSVQKLRNIQDLRLNIYVNNSNVGSSQNIYESLERGKGRYLFYVNDRDNVDKFKIEKLIKILKELEKQEVAFAKCHATGGWNADNYRIYKEGEESLLQFACRMDHPTGYIFKRDYWKSIKNRKALFEKQIYGDYPITQVCAIMAKSHKGALIYGDICDLKRLRIDFTKVKSGYYVKRKDKRLWYTPEVIDRELKIGQMFLKKIGVQKDIREQILINRYVEYLSWCVTGYKDRITDPVCTAHYNYYPPQDFFHVFFASIVNGIKLWGRTSLLCIACKKELRVLINKATRQEYIRYFKYVLAYKLHIGEKTAKEYEKKNYELYKRDEALKTYESWMNAMIDREMISESLFNHGYHHIAIYGMGRIGKHLWKELRNSKVHVDYIIDQKLSQEAPYYEDVNCFHIESNLPPVDVIIVTISGESEKIMEELRKKVKWQVKTINDILFALM
jgi:glycosyltransferase involved in cell wall biosynthesis